MERILLKGSRLLDLGSEGMTLELLVGLDVSCLSLFSNIFTFFSTLAFSFLRAALLSFKLFTVPTELLDLPQTFKFIFRYFNDVFGFG